jgi:hypothetical protein
MATSIAAGSTVAVALPAGATITFSGYGNAQFAPPTGGGPGSRALRPIMPTPTTLGPFALAHTINVSADVGGTGVSVTVQAGPATVQPAPQISRGFAWLTDSRGQQTYDQSATAITGRPRPFTVMNALAGQPFDFINNAGVNGDTISGAAARLMNSSLGVGFGAIGDASTACTTAPGINIPAVTDVGVALGVNDFIGNGVQAVDAYANITLNVFAPILALGKRLWVCTVVQPNSGVAGYTAAKATQLSLFNEMLRKYVQSTQGTYLLDFEKAMLSGSSLSLESANNDFRDTPTGLHENNSGGYKQGRWAASVVSLVYPPRTGLLPASNGETYNVSSSLPFMTRNPMQIGTSAISTTGYSGSAAGSAVAGSAGLNNANFVRSGTPTCVLSAVARTDNTGGQNTKMVATWAANNDSLEHRGNSVHADAVVGGLYEARCEVTFTGPAGAALVAADNLKGVQLYVQYNDGTTNFFSYEMAVTTASDVALVGSVVKAIFRTRPLQIPASGTPTILRANLGMFSAGATGSPEVSFGLISMVRVG